MVFRKFQDFLGNLVKGQRKFFFSGTGQDRLTSDELLDKLMGHTGEVSAIVTAREILNIYKQFTVDEKVAFFSNLEQNYNANQALVKSAFENYDADPSSMNLNSLSRAAEPLRQELLRRLNHTANAAYDLVCMREDLLGLLKSHAQLKSVDDDFMRMFSSWFGRGFLVLQNIDWSTSAAILEKIIRYEAVHEIKDWDDLRRRVDPENRRCFAFFHPALNDEPLIFVEVALSKNIPRSINEILDTDSGSYSDDYTTACFYSISNCQPGLKSISFGNFLIKQVVQELRSEFPTLKHFVTLSPIPGFNRWLYDENSEKSSDLMLLVEELIGMKENQDRDVCVSNVEREALQLDFRQEIESSRANDAKSLNADRRSDLLKRVVTAYLLTAKRGIYPLDPVARFHLGNGASIYKIRIDADLSSKGLKQSSGTMVNYSYELSKIESNHEQYATEGVIEHSDVIKNLLAKL